MKRDLMKDTEQTLAELMSRLRTTIRRRQQDAQSLRKIAKMLEDLAAKESVAYNQIRNVDLIRFGRVTIDGAASGVEKPRRVRKRVTNLIRGRASVVAAALLRDDFPYMIEDGKKLFHTITLRDFILNNAPTTARMVNMPIGHKYAATNFLSATLSHFRNRYGNVPVISLERFETGHTDIGHTRRGVWRAHIDGLKWYLHPDRKYRVRADLIDEFNQEVDMRKKASAKWA